MSSASVYQRKDRLIFCGRVRTTAGVLIERRPIITMDADCDDAWVGQALLWALAGWQDGVPHPARDEFPKIALPLFDAVGVKSDRKFAEQTRSIDVTNEDGAFSLAPWRNAGDGSFLPLRQKEFSLPPNPTPVQLGQAIQRALALCE